jgi:hypothetical protein
MVLEGNATVARAFFARTPIECAKTDSWTTAPEIWDSLVADNGLSVVIIE